jgi:preprotein translocase subunit SecD
MNRYPLWRYLLIALLVLVSVIYSIPNLYPEDPAIQISAREGKTLAANLIAEIKEKLTSENIAPKAISVSDSDSQSDSQSVLIRFNDTDTQLKAQDYLQNQLGSDYTMALNLAPTTPKWLLALGAEPMKLGLDLRGGVHFLLSVDVDSMVKTRQMADMHSMGSQLQSANIRYAGFSTPSDQSGFLLQFHDASMRSAALEFLQQHFPDYLFSSFEQSTIRAQLSPSAMTDLMHYAVDQNLTILRTRVSELGISEPVIAQQGSNEISVDLPGIQDMARAKSLIGKMATIRLQLVDTVHDANDAVNSGLIPAGSDLYKTESGEPVLLKTPTVLAGSAIINAAPMTDENGRPAVSIRVGGSDVNRFHQITGDNIGKPLAVLYIENQAGTHQTKIEKVINIATINDALSHNFQISGLSSMQSAENLALLLRSGAYTARMSFIEERVIGPSLGKQNIEMGLHSLEIGSLLVIVFMILYYRLFGFIADLALILNIFFIISILSIMGSTLSLPGIAGIVLTVGMAVDANVLINERIREELRNGVSPKASIAAGYDRAFSTIVDANVTTLIIALILLTIGSTAVQNFAVTLIIGLLTSMFTAIFFTRAIVNLIYGGKKSTGNVKPLSIGINLKK